MSTFLNTVGLYLFRHSLKADHPLFDWLINCVILNHF